MANNGEKVEAVTNFLFSGSKITASWLSAIIKVDSILKSRGVTLPTKYSQSYCFSSSHVWMLELDQKEGWVLQHWCFQTVMLEKTLESCLDCQEIKPVNPKGNQPWIFTGKTEAEALIFWLPDAKDQLIGKDPDSGKDWGQEEKRWQRMRQWDSIINSMDVSLSKLREIVKNREVYMLQFIASQGVRCVLAARQQKQICMENYFSFPLIM